MKRHLLYILLCATALTACQDDFDELEDSVQRRITFTFDTTHLFDDVLIGQQGSYILGAPATLDADHLLRITAYCYNPNDSLLQQQTLLCRDMKATSQAIFRHLDKSVDYRFVFVADVVKQDPYVDYYESWYQMNTRRFDTFYFFSDSRNEQPQHDMVHTAMVTTKPANQCVGVELKPLTYNGYCILQNANKSDRLTGFVGYVESFVLSTRSWKQRTSVAYNFSYYQPTETSITIPLNLSYADSVIYAKVKSTTLAGTDSIIVNIRNMERHPFALTIDCETMTLKDKKFY